MKSVLINNLNLMIDQVAPYRDSLKCMVDELRSNAIPEKIMLADVFQCVFIYSKTSE